jgi:hypothetical protein
MNKKCQQIQTEKVKEKTQFKSEQKSRERENRKSYDEKQIDLCFFQFVMNEVIKGKMFCCEENCHCTD